MKAVVKPIDIPQGRRVLAISDIHGNLPWLKALLDKAGFCREDILVLVGDMVEKGEHSLATLRYLMELSRTHTIHTLCGNCDNLAVDFVDGSMGLGRDFFRYYLGVWKEKSLILQMAQEIGFSVGSEDDLPALRETLRENFAPELDYLRALPTILTAPGFVFVHGGVPSYEGMEELDAWDCMKNDDFMGQGHAFPHYCVVGHWPVTLYRRDYPCSDPIIDRARKIISIDGGCVLKADGQLNALVIPGPNREDFTWVRYDDCPVGVALDRQAESVDPIIVHWTDHDVDVLERGEEFSLVRHKATGRVLQVLSKYLNNHKGQDWCEDSTDYRLGVEPGETLSIVEETSQGWLVKKDGVTGWYRGRLERAENAEKYVDNRKIR